MNSEEQHMVQYLMDRPHLLSDVESNFIYDLDSRSRELTVRQRRWLDGIFDRVLNGAPR